MQGGGSARCPLACSSGVVAWLTSCPSFKERERRAALDTPVGGRPAVRVASMMRRIIFRKADSLLRLQHLAGCPKFNQQLTGR